MHAFKIVGLGVFGTVLLANGSPPRERVVDVADPVVTISIEGQQVDMELTPEVPVSLVLSPATADRLGLKGSLFSGVHYVGHTKVHADSNSVKVAFGDEKPTRERGFFIRDHEWTSPYVGTLNPMAVPEPVVTFRLREPVSDERIIRLPMFETSLGGYHARLRVGDAFVPAFFSLGRGETMLTAAAGKMVSDEYGGRMAGETYPLHIRYGIERPVRRVAFDRAPSLGALVLTNIVVRTQDTGSVAGIKEEGDDPNEILVTAKDKKAAVTMTVGLDALEPCSSLTFDRIAKEIRLSCRPV